MPVSAPSSKTSKTISTVCIRHFPQPGPPFFAAHSKKPSARIGQTQEEATHEHSGHPTQSAFGGLPGQCGGHARRGRGPAGPGGQGRRGRRRGRARQARGARQAAAARTRGHAAGPGHARSEEHTSELQSPCNLVCRLLLEKKKKAL